MSGAGAAGPALVGGDRLMIQASALNTLQLTQSCALAVGCVLPYAHGVCPGQPRGTLVRGDASWVRACGATAIGAIVVDSGVGCVALILAALTRRQDHVRRS
jgi:hypothetical protein